MRTLHLGEPAKRRNGETATRRPAFTLVEMIIVITIMAILTVIAVAVAPRFQENQRVVKGADLISQWLLTAKQRALRDQVPTGVRLNPDQPGSLLVRGLEYIQQPDDFYVQPGVDPNSPQIRRISITRYSGPPPPPGTNPPYFDLVDLEPVPQPPSPPPPVVADFSGGFGPTNPNLWPVQIGDFLEYQGTGLVHRIIGVSATTLQLEAGGPNPPYPWAVPTSPIGSPPFFIRQYRIIRAPRVLTGETPLDLPKDVAIDASPKFSGDPFGPPQDILFSPSGGVLSPPGVGGMIIFWVRDTTKDPSEPGDQYLVVIQVRTGFIAVHPVDPSQPYSLNTYRFAFDARSSGL